jgi:hypothetical protein
MKPWLNAIAKKLGINYGNKPNVASLCESIRVNLMYRELKERAAKSKIKWFYFMYETRPETITR